MAKPYVIGFRAATLNDMRRLDRSIINRVLETLLYLARNVNALPHQTLTGQLAGFYKLRIGDYRVIYRLEHDERLVIVEAVGHRRDIYEH